MRKIGARYPSQRTLREAFQNTGFTLMVLEASGSYTMPPEFLIGGKYWPRPFSADTANHALYLKYEGAIYEIICIEIQENGISISCTDRHIIRHDGHDGFAHTILGNGRNLIPRCRGEDDLKRIRGIGVLIEKMLNRLGYFRYDQIAAWTRSDVERVAMKLAFAIDRIDRQNWIGQAQILSQGGSTEFSQKWDRANP